MKTRSDFTKSHYKAGILSILSICLFSIGTQAQHIQRPDEHMRQPVMRQPQIHQQPMPNMNRFPAQAHPVPLQRPVSETNRPQVINDRPANVDHANSGTFARPDNAGKPDNRNFNRPDITTAPIGNVNNRPANGSFNRLDNINNRPADVTYNHPGRDYHPDYENHPRAYPNNGNWAYNNNNRGGKYNGYNNYRKPVYNAYNPNWRYAYVPRRNSVFYSLPSSYYSINFGGYDYRYYDGIFYRPYNDVFRVVAPPFGIFVNTLPFGYSRIYVNDYPYYYFDGVYYDHRGSNYVVVSPPVGAVVESLPDDYQTVTIDGETYYMADGAQYKPVVQSNGEIWYEVIKSNR